MLKSDFFTRVVISQDVYSISSQISLFVIHRCKFFCHMSSKMSKKCVTVRAFISIMFDNHVDAPKMLYLFIFQSAWQPKTSVCRRYRILPTEHLSDFNLSFNHYPIGKTFYLLHSTKVRTNSFIHIFLQVAKGAINFLIRRTAEDIIEAKHKTDWTERESEIKRSRETTKSKTNSIMSKKWPLESYKLTS